MGERTTHEYAPVLDQRSGQGGLDIGVGRRLGLRDPRPLVEGIGDRARRRLLSGGLRAKRGGDGLGDGDDDRGRHVQRKPMQQAVGRPVEIEDIGALTNTVVAGNN